MKSINKYSEKDFYHLLGFLYEAAGDIMKFPQFLAELEKITHSRNIVLRRTNYPHKQDNGFMSSNMITRPDVRMRDNYNSYFGSRNPLVHGMNGFPNPALRIPGKALNVFELVSEKEFFRSEFYNDYYREWGWHYTMNLTFASKADRLFSLTPIRAESQPDFDKEDIAFVERLSPHVSRAFMLSFQLTRLHSIQTALEDAINHLPMAVFLIDESATVYAHNAQAQKILLQQDGLLISKSGELKAEKRSISTQLEKVIHSCIQTSAQKGECAGQVLSIYRKSDKAPYHAMVTPLRTTEFTNSIQPPFAAVFVSDPEGKSITSEQALMKLFGLTRAEATVATHLAEGHELSEIGELLHVSKNTVKTHSKHIYDKTRVKRKDGLVRLLLTSVTSLRKTTEQD